MSFNVNTEVVQSDSLLLSEADIIQSVYDTLKANGVLLYDDVAISIQGKRLLVQMQQHKVLTLISDF